MKMLVMLSGERYLAIFHPFMILKNEHRNYSIRGVPENLPGVSYITDPRGWMYNKVMVLWLRERLTLAPLPHNRKIIMLLDNCGWHALTDFVLLLLEDINSENRFFPKSETIADAFITQEIKNEWRGQ